MKQTTFWYIVKNSSYFAFYKDLSLTKLGRILETTRSQNVTRPYFHRFILASLEVSVFIEIFVLYVVSLNDISDAGEE